MCGRTCLTIEPKEVQCACKYKTDSVENCSKIPEFRNEYNCGEKYQPSYNIAPTDISLAMVSSLHFDCDANKNERTILPMVYGMIPYWHKGNFRKHKLTTHNCRIERIMESKLYKNALQRGQRCVVLCEGYYEWCAPTHGPSDREVYYLYMPQKDGIKIHDKSTWDGSNINILKLAGIFDIWENEEGDKIYSFSVVTLEANSKLSWLQHRMPVVLETDKEVTEWLDFKQFSSQQALSKLKPAIGLCWHEVSKTVNSSMNKSEQCNKPKKKIYKNDIRRSLTISQKMEKDELQA